MPPINEDIARYLLERYPSIRPEGLQGIWMVAWRWIAENVSGEFLWTSNFPAAFESAAVLRVQAICTTDDAQLQQALYSASSELIGPYAS